MRKRDLGSIALTLLLVGGCKRAPVVNPVTAKTQATTTTAPATTRSSTTGPSAPKTFIDLVKRNYPDFPATQPLEISLDRKDAARIVLRDPIYLDAAQHLWITRPDADATDAVLLRVGTETDHLIRERPAYVHWRYEPAKGRQPGRSIPVLVCPTGGGDDFELVETGRRISMKAQRGRYRWRDAF